MSTTPLEPLKAGEAPAPLVPNELVRNQGLIAWSSFFFALLQSICGAFVAISGLRLAIGIGSFALSTGAATAMERFHADWIRIPMMAIALLGSLLNLGILLQIRHLRNRPAAQWRQKPLSLHQRRMERAQMVLSLATLVLLGVEEYLHFSSAPLALASLAGHLLIESRMQTLTEADRQFEDLVVGRQNQDIARRIQDR